MKKFKGVRPQELLVAEMKKLGYEWTKASQNQYKYHFSDYNGFINYKKNKFVMVNVFNGTFWVNELDNNTRIADTNSEHLDNVYWYDDILKAINEPLLEIPISKINSAKDIENYLNTSASSCCNNNYYYMEDELSNNPVIRLIEVWEIHDRMYYSFERMGGNDWCWKNSNKLLTVQEMSQSIFDIIQRDYYISEKFNEIENEEMDDENEFEL